MALNHSTPPGHTDHITHTEPARPPPASLSSPYPNPLPSPHALLCNAEQFLKDDVFGLLRTVLQLVHPFVLLPLYLQTMAKGSR